MRERAGGPHRRGVPSAETRRGVWLTRSLARPSPQCAPLRGAVLCVHGHAVHARYEFLRAAAPGGPHDCYEGSLVQRLNALGLAVRAYDQQSFGASEGARQGTRGFVERFDDLVDDFLALAEPLKRWCAERRLPLFVLATSMGGCVVTRALQRRPKACDGAVFVAPMLSLEAAKKQPANRVLLPVVGALSAWAPTLRLAAGAVNERFPYLQEEMDRDPRCLSSRTVGTTVRLANEYLLATDAARADMDKLVAPFLTLHSPQDTSVDPEASEFLHAHAAAQDKHLESVEGMWHNLLIEPGCQRVLDCIEKWLSERC